MVAVLMVGMALSGAAVVRPRADASAHAQAASPVALTSRTPLIGAYRAAVLRVLDGDTLEVRVHVWMGQEVVTRVRLAGIDAPELAGACRAERDQAARSRDRLAALAGSTVVLTHIRPDKYFGRVGAQVLGQDGRDLAALLIADGLARHDGGRRQPWCVP